MAALVEWIRLNWFFLALITAVVLAFILLRTTPTPGIDSSAMLDRTVTTGQPIVLDFYSNL